MLLTAEPTPRRFGAEPENARNVSSDRSRVSTSLTLLLHSCNTRVIGHALCVQQDGERFTSHHGGGSELAVMGRSPSVNGP